MISIANLRKGLKAGDYTKRLAHIYCKKENEVGGHLRRIDRCLTAYCHVFGGDESTEVAVYSAPGRTELGGNHTDHQQGVVLTGSVDLDAIAVAAPNGTDKVRIFSEGYGMTVISVSNLEKVPAEENSTPSLIRGVIAAVAQRGYQVGGFDAYVTSDVPGGSGLSSSACFEVLMGVMVNGLFCGGALPLEEIAKIGMFAENIYFGKPSGMLDQMGCSIGGMISVDFYDNEKPVWKAVDYDFSTSGYALCIVNTGADHADLTPDYSAIPLEMNSVAGFFGQEILSRVTRDQVIINAKGIRRALGDRALLRAIHYFDECDRTDAMVQALESKDFDAYLNLVSDSGRSSWMFLQNVSTGRNPASQPVASAIAMAEQILGGEGVVRVHGGGFAGTIQAYVPVDMVEAFRDGMDAFLYEGACRVTSIRPVGGCTLMD